MTHTPAEGLVLAPGYERGELQQAVESLFGGQGDGCRGCNQHRKLLHDFITDTFDAATLPSVSPTDEGTEQAYCTLNAPNLPDGGCSMRRLAPQPTTALAEAAEKVCREAFEETVSWPSDEGTSTFTGCLVPNECINALEAALEGKVTQ